MRDTADVDCVEPLPKKSWEATYVPPGAIAIDGDPMYCCVFAG